MHVYAELCNSLYKPFIVRDPEPESEEKPEQVRDVAEDSHAVDSESTGKETCETDQKPSNSDEVEETKPENKDKNQAGDMSSEPKDEDHVQETAECDGNKEECGSQDPTQEGSEAGSPDTNNQSSGKSQPSVEKEQSPLWTESRLKKDWRKFNLDLSPKVGVLFCYF